MISFAIFKFLEFFLMLFGKRFRKNFFLFLAWIAYHLAKKHRRIIRQNLKFVYGDTLDEKFINHIERYCFQNLLLNFMQMIENRHHSIDELMRNVTMEPNDIIERAKEEGRPVIFTTGHFGRWELGGIAISALIKPSMVVYKQMNNRYFQHYLNESRERFRIVSVEKNGAVKHLVKYLKKGLAVSLLIDTNLNRRDGILVDFFGRPTRTTAAAAYLARKMDALIIPVFITTEDEENFTVSFSDPIEVARTDDEEADIHHATQQQAKALEAAVKKYPHLWFWCHKRWRTDHPEIYRS